MGYYNKYFIFNLKNWSTIGYKGFRDFRRQILSYAVQIRIVELIG